MNPRRGRYTTTMRTPNRAGSRRPRGGLGIGREPDDESRARGEGEVRRGDSGATKHGEAALGGSGRRASHAARVPRPSRWRLASCAAAALVAGALGWACGDPSPAGTGPQDGHPDGVAIEDVGDAAPDVGEVEVSQPDAVVDTGQDTDPVVATWPPLPEEPACALDAGAPLLEEALAHIDREVASFGYSLEDLGHSTHYFAGGYLDDPFLLTWQRETLMSPARIPCVVNGVTAVVDAALDGPYPVSSAIRHAAALLDRWEERGPTPDAVADDLAQAIARACAAAGRACAPEVPPLPAALEEALIPIVLAVADGLAARRQMVEAAPALPGGWVTSGGLGATVFAPYASLEDPAVRDHLVGEAHLPALNLAAARIAWAVEQVDWAAWRDAPLEPVAIPTPIGWFRIGGAGDDVYPANLGETWFLLELGGDDTYLYEVAATTGASFGVNVVIDLGGDDVYGYPEAASPHDRPDLLPADAHGRYAGDASYGPVTLSRLARQGSGRHGIGLLFELGGGDDVYRSLAMSQGYAHLGVGVLYDDGGRDEYAAEQASQGSAVFGIGLLLDAGAADDRYAIHYHGQGAAGPGAVGLLYDGGGDDRYVASPGHDEAFGGPPLYFSAQLPGTANHSGAQGAGIGIRWDERGIFLSGGLGVLRDRAGDDVYQCGVFCQGAGFWQGIGVLADGAGADRYDGLWYTQGGAAHYAIGALLDGGGDDVFGGTFPARNVHLGAGHDFSVGVLVNEAGDDRYHAASLAMGAGNCNGVGLFVDNAGDDTYVASAASSTGYAGLGECVESPDRPLAPTLGVFIDAGGADAYTFPAVDGPAPGEGAHWGRAAQDLPSVRAVGLDAEGITGLEAR